MRLEGFSSEIQKCIIKISRYIEELNDVHLLERKTMYGFYLYNIRKGFGAIWVKPTKVGVHLYLTQGGLKSTIYATPQGIVPVSRLKPNGWGGNSELSLDLAEIESNWKEVTDMLDLALRQRSKTFNKQQHQNKNYSTINNSETIGIEHYYF